MALKPKYSPLCISEGVYHLSYLIWKLQKRQIPALFLPTICYSKSKNIISHFWFDVNEQLAFNLNLESHKSRSKTDDVFLGLLSHCVALFCSLPWTHVPHASAPHIQVKYRRVSVAKYVAEYILRMRHLTITNRALSILGTRATMTKVQSHCPKKNKWTSVSPRVRLKILLALHWQSFFHGTLFVMLYRICNIKNVAYSLYKEVTCHGCCY